MNDGYLALLIMVMALVLLATGWKEQLAGPVRDRSIVLFFLAGWVGWWVTIPLGERYSISGTMIAVGIAAFAGIRQCGALYSVLHLLSSASMVAAVYVFVQQLLKLDPVLFIWGPTYDLVLLVGLLVACFVRLPLQQLTVVTGGLVMGELLSGWIQGESFIGIGDSVFFDRWWLILAVSRIAALIMEGIHKAWKAKVSH